MKIFMLLFVMSLNTWAYTSKEIPLLEITPISHASFSMTWDKKIILVDPVGNFSTYEKLKKPSLVLITHTHHDHLEISRLKTYADKQIELIAPQAVIDKIEDLNFKRKITLKNGEDITLLQFKITAFPMYNTTKERTSFHEKGVGNGYIIEHQQKRIYISGDTENIPEMNQLQNIDVAFLCMNLPYTMTIDQAKSATLAIKPLEVIPYHYRGIKDENVVFSDVQKFKTEVQKENPKINVTLLKWYE